MPGYHWASLLHKVSVKSTRVGGSMYWPMAEHSAKADSEKEIGIRQ